MSYSFRVESVLVGRQSVHIPQSLRSGLSTVLEENLKSVALPDSFAMGVSADVDGVSCTIDGRVHKITPLPAKKASQRVREYLQNSGIARLDDAVPLERTREINQRLRAETSSGVKATVFTAIDIVSNASTSIQKTQDVIRGFSNKTPAPLSQFGKVFGCFNSALWLGLGVSELYASSHDIDFSETIKDHEGVLRAKARLWSARLVWVGAMVDGATKVADLVSNSGFQALCKGLETAATGLFGISSLIGILVALLGMFRCCTFRNRLKEQYLDNPELTDAQKYLGAYRFLKNKVIVTQEERAAIAIEVRNEGKGQDEIEKRIDQLTQKKVRYIKRRTSVKSVGLLATDREPTAQEAKKIVEAVMKNNHKKILLYAATILASLVALAGMLLSSIGGPQFFVIVSLLYAISTGMYAGIGVAGLFSTLVARDTDAPLYGNPAMEYVPF